jgi:hypothetical protein
VANIANLVVAPGKPSPDIIVHGAEATAPVAAQVLADSGPVTLACKVMAVVTWGADDAVATPEIAHRNAANAADIEVDYGGVPTPPLAYVGWFVLAAGERIVVRAKVAGTAAKVYQAAIFIWLLP